MLLEREQDGVFYFLIGLPPAPAQLFLTMFFKHHNDFIKQQRIHVFNYIYLPFLFTMMMDLIVYAFKKMKCKM